MAVTLLLILAAVTEERNSRVPGEFLDETQSKLLAVVLNSPASVINRTVQEQFSAIFSGKARP
jgi:hypothetical protein